MTADAAPGAPNAAPGTIDLRVRPATAADAALIAGHGVAMFRDMGQVPTADAGDALAAAASDYLAGAIARGEYHGWLAVAPGGAVVAGAGVQLRAIVPSPAPAGVPGPLTAPQALLLNVYTAPAWRRRGLAERLVREALAWARGRGASSVRLHASAAGRGLYARLGFAPTNEMIYRPPGPNESTSA